MDGFFEKYGRVIIVAVAICFVLLYLTPMRNVVGSSINGFAGNFANKVGDSLGTVKMPDGSDNIAKEKSSKLITGGEFNNKIPSEAKTVIFTDEKAPKGTVTTDLTVAKDGDVVGWLDGTTWKVSTQDPNKAITFNEKCSEMFEYCNKLNSITFNNVDTSKVIDMGYMFSGCRSLISLNLSNFNTSACLNMNRMFNYCTSLITIKWNNWNTSNVTSMAEMFRDCQSMQSLNFSGFNVDKVSNMRYMFQRCYSLTSLNMSELNINNKTNIQSIFDSCNKLKTKSIKISQITFNTIIDLNISNNAFHQYFGVNKDALDIIDK